MPATISHYRLLEPLGEGGMGVVYAAVDESLGRKVALKFCRTGGDPRLRRALLEEARAASVLVHPNIAQVYELGETESGDPFIAMEFVGGKSLAEELQRRRPERHEAVRIAAGIARALEASHTKGIVHRDIKPSNVRLTETGEVKVLDFGLARPERHLQRTSSDSTASVEGVIRGTPAYMAPEQARGTAVDHRADLFSLGAVFYECLTGTPPFSGSTPLDLLAKVVDYDPPPPSSVNRAASPTLDHIVLRLLAKHPQDRYQSAGELLAALDTLTPPKEPARVKRSRRWRWSAGAAAAVCLAGLLVWRWNGVPEPPAEARRWYAEGAAAMADGTYLKAARALEHASVAAPQFAMAHAMLAKAWDELEYPEKAKRELLLAMPPGRSLRLSAGDSLRLRGIHSVLTRNWTAAERAWRDLASSASGAERAGALLELGRTCERADRPAGAIEAYRAATAADPNSAAAFLRLGTLYVRQRDAANAGPALERAAGLYRSASNLEGETECLYQQARLTRDPSASLALLDGALNSATLVGNEQQIIQVRLLIADRRLLRGEAEAAIQEVNRALATAERAGLENLEARCLIDRGRIELLRGHAERGKPDLQLALTTARRNGAHPTEARAEANLGSLLIETGTTADVEEGIRHVERALSFYREAGYRAEANLSLGILGRARAKTGDYRGAAQAFAAVIETTRSAALSRELGVAQENLGGVYTGQANLPEAYRSFSDACRTYGQLGLPNDLARASASLATVAALLGRRDDAARYLREAAAAAPASPTPLLRSQMLRASMMAALLAGDHALARKEAETASGSAPADQPEMRAAAMVGLGLAWTRSAAAARGRQECGRAGSLAAGTGNRALESDAALCIAEASAAAGDGPGAAATFEGIRPRLEAAGNNEALWRGWALLARSGPAGGRAEAARKGAAALRELQSGWPAADFASYSSRPDIRNLIRELGPLAARRSE